MAARIKKAALGREDEGAFLINGIGIGGFRETATVLHLHSTKSGESCFHLPLHGVGDNTARLNNVGFLNS